MRPSPVSLVATFAVIATAGAALSVPGVTERVAMLSRDGRDEAAVRVGTEAFRQGDHDRLLLSSVVDLNSRSGDPAVAEAAIRSYLASHPDDPLMLQRAVEFYDYRQDVDALVETLRHLIDVTSDADSVAKLARLYRVYGRYQEEYDLLYRFRDTRLEADLALRLGELLVREQDYQDARGVLAKVVGEPGMHQLMARRLLFDSMVETGEFDAASDLAQEWVKSDLKPEELGLFVLRLVRAGANDQAVDLAASVAQGQTSEIGDLAWTIGREGGLPLARSVVDRWLADADRATARQAIRLYVDLAISTGQARTVLLEVLAGIRGGDGATDPARAVALARALYEHQGYGAISGLRPLLTARLLAYEPMFGAALARAEKNDIALRYFLAQTELGDLAEDEAVAWAAMAEDAFKPDELFANLMQRWRSGTLPPALVPALQRAATWSDRYDPKLDIWKPVLTGAITAEPQERTRLR